MPTKPKSSTGEDRYLDLVRKHPLRPIRTEAELDRAIAVIDSLIDMPALVEEEEDYKHILGMLIHAYESKTYPLPEISEAEMLQYLIEAKGVSQAQVCEATKIGASTLSEVLNGKRALTPKAMRTLGAYFQVDPGVFL